MSDRALLRAVATHGLPGSSGVDTLVDEPLSDDRFAALTREVDHHRVIGHMLGAVLTGALPATDDQATEVASRHADWCLSMLGLERELLRIVERLDASGIDVVVLKGTAAAHQYYYDPAQRMFGDNDILVRGHQFDLALQVLAEAGYERRKAPVRPDFERRFGKGATLYLDDDTELDVHRSLAFGAFGLALDLEDLWATTGTFDLGGRQLRSLGADGSLIHAFFHTALSGAEPRFATLRDLAQQLTVARYDAERVIDLGQRWGVTAVFKRALLLLARHLEFEVHGPIGTAVASYRPSPRESRAIASYASADRSFTAAVLAALPFLPSIRERGAFLRAVLLPSRQFTSIWGSDSLLSWWLRGSRTMIRRLR